MSLRRRLLLTLASVVAPVVLLLTGSLYWAVASATWSDFDRDLSARAGTWSALLEYDDDGYEFELGPHPAPVDEGLGDPSRAGPWTWIQLRRGDAVLSQSRADSSNAGPRPAWPGVEESLGTAEGSAQVRRHVWLADTGGRARAFRAVTLRWVPEVEPEERAALQAGELAPPEAVTLIVARSADAQRSTLWKIGAWFVALGLITLGTAMFAAFWAVGRGLSPVAALVRELEAVDDRHLDRRLEVSRLPRELAPIGERTNALLERLERAFVRERRFTADAAHELRTPLTVLQAELELALRKPRPAEAYRDSLARSLDEVRGLARLVEDLLILARAEGGQVEVTREPVPLRALVERCLGPHLDAASTRGLEIDIDIDPARTVHSDPDLLRVVLSNLISNAVAYTERDGWIRVETPHDGMLAVVDSGPPIPEAQRERLFDPFWRGDDARTDAGLHCGLGLALVRSVSAVLHLTPAVEQNEDGSVRFVLRDGAGSTGDL